MDQSDARRATDLWNKFIGHMEEAEEAWQKIMDFRQEVSAGELEQLPSGAQKGFARFSRSKFDVLLPRLVDYWRAYGGLSSLKSKALPKETKEEVNENE